MSEDFPGAEYLEPLQAWVGKRCTEIVRNEFSWTFAFEAGAVTATCTWRVLHDGGIVLTSSDDGHQFGLPAPLDAQEAAQVLVGQRVTAVQVAPLTSDMRITLNYDTVVELLNHSASYEAWEATVTVEGHRAHIIALGGGAFNVT